jgi:hypothetical protein
MGRYDATEELTQSSEGLQANAGKYLRDCQKALEETLESTYVIAERSVANAGNYLRDGQTAVTQMTVST